MRTYKYIAIICIAVSIAFLSCENEEIMRIDTSTSFLNFDKKVLSSSGDTLYYELDYVALYSGDTTESVVKLPLRITGLASDQELTYQLTINEERSKGNLIDGVHFRLDKEQTFKPGVYLDSALLVIDVKKLRNDEANGSLRVELVENDNFGRGIELLQFITVNISGAGLTTAPTFWYQESLTNYGGEYLAIKAEKFIELNAIPSDTWSSGTKELLYAYCKRTYLWFEENPTFDEKGNRIHFKGSVEY